MKMLENILEKSKLNKETHSLSLVSDDGISTVVLKNSKDMVVYESSAPTHKISTLLKDLNSSDYVKKQNMINTEFAKENRIKRKKTSPLINAL